MTYDRIVRSNGRVFQSSKSCRAVVRAVCCAGSHGRGEGGRKCYCQGVLAHVITATTCEEMLEISPKLQTTPSDSRPNVGAMH